MRTCIRPARADEAEILTSLAFRSKAHWGYDAAFLEDCRGDLTITPQQMESSIYFVLERTSQVAGFYGLCAGGPVAELGNFFVAPEHIGTGLGRLLWQHLVDTARQLGVQQIFIDSDPQAEGFYHTMGAITVGATPSMIRPGRVLPRMMFRVV